MNTPRDGRYDFIKGLLMLGVIWGHLITAFLANEPNHVAIHWIVRTYDMPFFMLISGYFLRFSIARHRVLPVLADKVTALLLPCVLWSILASRFQNFISYYFLMAVFASSVALTLTSLLKRRSWQVACVALVTALLHCFPDVPANLSYLFPFFALGYFVDVNRLFRRRWALPALLAWVAMLFFWRVEFNIWSYDGCLIGRGVEALVIVTFRLLIALAGLMGVGHLCVWAYQRFASSHHPLFQLLLECGRLTMPLYILQQIVIFKLLAPLMLLLCQRLGHNPLNFNQVVLGYVLAPLSALALIYVLVTAVRWSKARRPWSYLWGVRAYTFLKR